jgi:hypothetical protein
MSLHEGLNQFRDIHNCLLIFQATINGGSVQADLFPLPRQMISDELGCNIVHTTFIHMLAWINLIEVIFRFKISYSDLRNVYITILDTYSIPRKFVDTL